MADYFEREDDSGSRPTNVCGPITAIGLANRRKVWEMREYEGEETENGHHSA